MTSRPDPFDELRAVASFAVGAAAVIGVGYLISRIVRSRREQADNGPRSDGRSGRTINAASNNGRGEPLHELLARLDTPEAIERHNELIRQMHENARPSKMRAAERKERETAQRA